MSDFPTKSEWILGVPVESYYQHPPGVEIKTLFCSLYFCYEKCWRNKSRISKLDDKTYIPNYSSNFKEICEQKIKLILLSYNIEISNILDDNGIQEIWIYLNYTLT